MDLSSPSLDSRSDFRGSRLRPLSPSNRLRLRLRPCLRLCPNTALDATS